MPPRPLRRAALIVAAAVPVLAGCSGAPTYPILATAAPAQVPEHVYATRALEVTLSNPSSEPVKVSGGTVFSPYFERVDAVGIDVVLTPGDDAVVTLPLGVVTCPAGGGETSAQVVLEVGGEELLQSVVLEAKGLKALNREACAIIADDEG
ncbi:hypothetical protein [Demequina gelatinilytica]|uniref:hypothetical protein n=1 Tax=Demequina gelatinilytica TaxID=1638980 RepID=UPI000ADD9208|nr:hypothetical protein [Demequina gelatinilytica]